jgi:hypothetical protein
MARQTAILKAMARTWGEWHRQIPTDELRKDFPQLRHCRCIWSNNRFEVQSFACETPIGGVWQIVIIRHGDLEQVTYAEAQRIIHELFGEEIVAVEVYPSLATEWHGKSNPKVLWVLPETWPLPFGLHLNNAWGQPQEKHDG